MVIKTALVTWRKICKLTSTAWVSIRPSSQSFSCKMIVIGQRTWKKPSKRPSKYVDPYKRCSSASEVSLNHWWGALLSVRREGWPYVSCQHGDRKSQWSRSISNGPLKTWLIRCLSTWRWRAWLSRLWSKIMTIFPPSNAHCRMDSHRLFSRIVTSSISERKLYKWTDLWEKFKLMA